MKEKIKGQCECCGECYEVEADLSKDVMCEVCGEETQNFDTVEGSLFAPEIVKITI